MGHEQKKLEKPWIRKFSLLAPLVYNCFVTKSACAVVIIAFATLF